MLDHFILRVSVDCVILSLLRGSTLLSIVLFVLTIWTCYYQYCANLGLQFENLSSFMWKESSKIALLFLLPFLIINKKRKIFQLYYDF